MSEHQHSCKGPQQVIVSHVQPEPEQILVYILSHVKRRAESPVDLAAKLLLQAVAASLAEGLVLISSQLF